MNGCKGKRMMITGGCGGIGRAVAARFEKEGARVVISDILPIADGVKIAKKISQKNVTYVHCDVTQRDSVLAGVTRAVKILGGLDVAISNAGWSIVHPALQMPEDAWRKIIDLNLTGSFFFAQAAARVMLQNKRRPNKPRGVVLFTGTWVQEFPWPKCISYLASKGGQEMVMKGMAQELAAEGINCNLVAPGFVATGETQKHYTHDPIFREQVDTTVPLERLVSPEELAGTFAFLASDDAAYITGQSLFVDGGASLVKRQW